MTDFALHGFKAVERHSRFALGFASPLPVKPLLWPKKTDRVREMYRAREGDLLNRNREDAFLAKLRVELENLLVIDAPPEQIQFDPQTIALVHRGFIRQMNARLENVFERRLVANMKVLTEAEIARLEDFLRQKIVFAIGRTAEVVAQYECGELPLTKGGRLEVFFEKALFTRIPVDPRDFDALSRTLYLDIKRHLERRGQLKGPWGHVSLDKFGDLILAVNLKRKSPPPITDWVEIIE